MEQIGKRIRKERRALDLTQQDLAKRVGVTRSHIANIETGNGVASVELLEKIAKALNITIQIGNS